MKSLIHQESLSPEQDKDHGAYEFHPKAFRYEPCIDYNYFSGNSSSIGMSQEPYSHFTIQGKNLSGNNIPQGDRVVTLDPPYRQMVRDGVLKARHILIFNDNDLDLTLTELWATNDTIQNWSKIIDPNSSWCNDLLNSENRNFTVQFPISGSYGLTQVLYLTAVEELGFNTESPNRSPYDLFTPAVGIHYGAKKLKKCFNTYGNWRLAVRCYNGSIYSQATEKYAIEVYDKLFLSNIYDIISY